MNRKFWVDQSVEHNNSIQMIDNKIEFVQTDYKKTKYNNSKISYNIILNECCVGNVSYYSDNTCNIRWYERKLRIIFKDSSVRVGYQIGIHYPINIHTYTKPLSDIRFYLNGLIEIRNRNKENNYVSNS